MIFPDEYSIALNEHRIQKNFPNLGPDKFAYTSLKTEDYNCMAWAVENTEDWIQFDGGYDCKIETYINYFSSLGFTITEDVSYTNGIIKICLYAENNEFRHVARQLPNGRWTSKMGDWEDIEHETPDVLIGNFYGSKLIFMEKS